MRKIEEMYARFGRRGHGTCAECQHYTKYKYRDKPYRKCGVYGVTNSEATDWTGKWGACGMYDGEYNGPDIVSLWRERPSDDNEPIPGQMDLFGEDADAEE